jgi:hypothetical protein
MHCADGVQAQFTFEVSSQRAGHGSGRSHRGPLTFTFGMNTEDALAHLALPEGRTLVGDAKAPRMVPRRSASVPAGRGS